MVAVQQYRSTSNSNSTATTTTDWILCSVKNPTTKSTQLQTTITGATNNISIVLRVQKHTNSMKITRHNEKKNRETKKGNALRIYIYKNQKQKQNETTNERRKIAFLLAFCWLVQYIALVMCSVIVLCVLFFDISIF